MADETATAAPQQVLRLARTLAASRQVVFQAFAHADALRVWFCPPQFVCIAAEVDFRVGGHYRVDIRSPEGRISRVSGTYREIRRPERLVFSWRLEPDHDPVGCETVITVELRDIDSGSELVMTHTNLPTVLTRDRYAWGMNGALDKLQILIEQNRPTAGAEQTMSNTPPAGPQQ